MKQIIKVKYQIGLSENFIDTNFVIFSHDQNTVELYIELNKHMDAVKVLFVGAGIYAERTAEQVADRPARYTVPFDSSLIRTSTPVTAYIYGYIDNDMSYDIGAVKFYVSPSAIDTLQPEEKEYYFEKLEGLMEGFENIFTQAEIARNEYEEQRQLAEDERVNNYLDWTDPETGLEARIDAKIRELDETIFEEISYFAGENITISDDFVISAKDTVYDDTAITTSLSNKLNKSSDTLDSYREKYHTLSSGTIDLNNANIFIHALSGDTTYSIINAAIDVAHSFSLIITMSSTLYTVTFPNSVKWHGGNIPDLSEKNVQYELLFTTTDGGNIWRASFGGMY